MKENGYLLKCKAELEFLKAQDSLDDEKKTRAAWLEKELSAKYMVEEDGGNRYYYVIEDRPSATTIMLRMMTYKVENNMRTYIPDPDGDQVKVRRYAKKMEYQEMNNKSGKFMLLESLPDPEPISNMGA